MRPALEFVLARLREKRVSRLIYSLAVVGLFCLAAARRFALPLTPILDIDSPNFLWPALLKLNGQGFIHNAGLNFLYPGFLYVLLRAFSDFRAIVIAQHLIGLAGGFFFLLTWNRLHDLVAGTILRRSVHQLIGLFGVGVYWLSFAPVIFEMQVRSEALGALPPSPRQ